MNPPSERPTDQEDTHYGYPASGNGSVHDICPTDGSCDIWHMSIIGLLPLPLPNRPSVSGEDFF